MTNLTAKENTVLNAILSFAGVEAEYAIHDLGSTWTDAAELVKETGLPMATVRGVLGSLGKKGLVDFEDEVNGKAQDILCLSPYGAEALIEGVTVTGDDTPAAETADEAAERVAKHRASSGVAAIVGAFADANGNQGKSRCAALREAARVALAQERPCKEFVAIVAAEYPGMNTTTMRCAYAQAKRGE